MPNVTVHGSHKYGHRLHELADRAENVLRPLPRLGRVSALRVRSAESRAYNQIDGLKPATAAHLSQCRYCRHQRERLIELWRMMNSWLMEHSVPTRRALSNADFRRQISDRRYQKLKSAVTALLKKEEDAEYDAELYASCFTPTPRRK